MDQGLINTFLHNFISPVTGRILCPSGYILEGDEFGIAYPSSSLRHLQIDVIQLRQNLNLLKQASFLIGYPNEQMENAQVLSSLNNGFLYNNEGIVSTLPTPQKLPLCYVATIVDLGASYDNGVDGVGATLTGGLFVTFIIDGQLPPLNSLVLVKNQTLSYQNGIYKLTQTASFTDSWILTRLDIYDQFGEIQPGDLVSVAYGTVNAQTLWVETQSVATIGTDSIIFLPFSPLSVLPEKNIWIGDSMDHPVASPTIEINNLPDLTFKKIWRGDSSDRPVESDALTTVESDLGGALENISNLLSTVSSLVSIVTSLQAAVAAIEAGFALIGGVAAILVLQTEVIALGSSLSALGDRVTDLENQVNGLTVTLVGEVTGTGLLSGSITTELQLTLDEIKVAQDTVDLNDQRITKLNNTIADGTDAMSFEVFMALVEWEAEITWQV